jgi:hypothetical protein
MPKVLLPYQQKYLANKSPVRIIRKSRRIGLSWALAGDCALDAARQDGISTTYISYDKETTLQFISDAASWARAYNLVASEVEEFVFTDEDDSILAFRLRFASGFNITALSSKPRNIRGRKGRLVFDEYSFHDDPEGLLKAAIALLIWGAKIDIISSVNSLCGFFEELCFKIAPERGYYVQETTFDDALADGLYKRICLVNGEEWSAENEKDWRAKIILEYGADADEELFCLPASEKNSLFDIAAVDRQAVGQWAEPQRKHFYLATIDPNQGGSDDWDFQIWDITAHPLQLVAQWHESNRLPSYCRAECLKLLDKYDRIGKVVMLVIEKNNGGLSQAESFIESRPKLRVEVVNTSATSKIINTDRITIAVGDGDVVYPKDWHGIKQMKKFSRTLREAIDGAKDDAVMSWAVGFGMLGEAFEELKTLRKRDISWAKRD